MPTHSLLFSKSTKGAARLNVSIRRTNRYQQYYMPSQHIYCGNLLPRRGLNPGPAEPEADMLPFEPARRAQYYNITKEENDRLDMGIR